MRITRTGRLYQVFLSALDASNRSDATVKSVTRSEWHDHCVTEYIAYTDKDGKPSAERERLDSMFCLLIGVIRVNRTIHCLHGQEYSLRAALVVLLRIPGSVFNAALVLVYYFV